MAKAIKLSDNFYWDSGGVTHNRKPLSEYLDETPSFSNTAGYHNSIFRGKDITSYLDDGTLWTRISSGKFNDLYVGDYIKKNNITWRIAAFDYYLHKGYFGLTKHHAIIVPDESLSSSKMNNENTTKNGYKSSLMHTDILPTVLSDYILPIFSSHVIEHEELITNSIDDTGFNRHGSNSGCSNNWTWETINIDLMNEVQIFGSIVWSSSGYDIGIDNVQFPLFRLLPQSVSNNSRFWLKTISTNSKFVCVGSSGASDEYDASIINYIRPYFLID